MGIVPAVKILDVNNPGFHFEVFLGSDKCAPVPLGGLQGLATLFDTIREIPVFSKVPPVKHEVPLDENIEISSTDFAKNVSIKFRMWTSYVLQVLRFFLNILIFSGFQNRQHKH